MTEVVLKPLRRADIARCVELEAELFPGDDPWSGQAFHAELAAGHHYLGAYRDGELVGYAGLAVTGRRHGEYEANVHTLGVAPRHRRGGVGTRLLQALLEHADDLDAPVFLEVRTDNTAALALYAEHGFVQLGVRRRYYQPSGADAYTMRRPQRSLTGEAHR